MKQTSPDGPAAVRPSFAALVLAGERGGTDPVAVAAGVAHKSLAPVAGRPMLDRVLDALAASPGIAETVVAAGTAAVADHASVRGVRVVPTGPSPSRTVAAAWETLGRPVPLLVTTSDHPLLTPAMVADFCLGAAARGADIAAGLVTRPVLLAAFPDSRRTWLRFSDAPASGANLFALMTAQGMAAVAFWQRVEQELKRPWRIAAAFGWTTVLRYLAGRLTLEDAFAVASRTIGARAAPVLLDQAEAAIDVDKPDDLLQAEAILARRAPAP